VTLMLLILKHHFMRLTTILTIYNHLNSRWIENQQFGKQRTYSYYFASIPLYLPTLVH
jgi:hypothetical protein